MGLSPCRWKLKYKFVSTHLTGSARRRPGKHEYEKGHESKLLWGKLLGLWRPTPLKPAGGALQRLLGELGVHPLQLEWRRAVAGLRGQGDRSRFQPVTCCVGLGSSSQIRPGGQEGVRLGQDYRWVFLEIPLLRLRQPKQKYAGRASLDREDGRTHVNNQVPSGSGRPVFSL